MQSLDMARFFLLLLVSMHSSEVRPSPRCTNRIWRAGMGSVSSAKKPSCARRLCANRDGRMPSGQRFESGPGHKHVTKRGKLSHGQVLHICQRRNCQHYVRLLCAEHLDRLMCGAALHLKRHIGMHLPELSQLRQQEMVQRRLRSADDRRTCFKSGQPLQLAFAVGQRFESAVHMGKKRCAFHGEPYAAGNAGKQLAAKRLLQPVDGAGYGGLGQAQQPRRRRDPLSGAGQAR